MQTKNHIALTRTANLKHLDHLDMKLTAILDSIYAITPEDTDAYFANQEDADVQLVEQFLAD